MATLAERVTEAIETSGVPVAEIARACEISPQSVYDWKKGATQEIEGRNLVELARLTGFTERWIAKGAGPKRGLSKAQQHVVGVMEKLPPYKVDMLLKTVDVIAESGEPTESAAEQKEPIRSQK